ncbi:MAG: flagellar motor switch protein FliN [Candidatus Eremiobacteraeota bacterium]|nr:flagellar motor switch protein FliN [Candidatus Eremiobacteraeota bacterium]
MQKLADVMLAAAAGVFGRLVEHTVPASAAGRRDHEGSVHTDGDSLVTLAVLPALSDAQVVVRFSNDELSRVVNQMIGGADDAAEMGAMQLSIVSETVSQIAAAMLEALAKEVGVAAEGIKAELCTDATALPPPPFESYEGTVTVSAGLAPKISIDFAAITLSKLQSASSAAAASAAPQAASVATAPSAPPVAAAPKPPAGKQKAAAPAASVAPPSSAQSAAFASMMPTPIKAAHPGHANLDLVHDIPLQISAVLGQTSLPLRDVVSLASGSVFELDKNSTDPIDLYVNNILIARGEVVVVDDKFAVKISELNPTAQ